MNAEKLDIENEAVSSVYDWVGAAVIALVVVSIIFSLFFRVVNVSGDSMCDTLRNGEKLLLSGVLATPDYGDIVVVRRDNDTPLIKRVIGLPGDIIFIDDTVGVVYRNGEALDESYVRGGKTYSAKQTGAVTVPDGHVYVLGDNRSVSLDSRALGCQSMKNVVGVVTFRLNPFQSLRKGD